MRFIDAFADEIIKLSSVQQTKTHPWHGIETFDGEHVNVYIEIVPSDTVKYELDKTTGHLKIDRPQKYSNVCPAPYGFIPMTYCGDGIGALAGQKTGQNNILGDGDPLDICVLTEKQISHGDVVLQAYPIGGFCMIDGGEADDKIIAVLKQDSIYGGYSDISEVPDGVISRLLHYFMTYKMRPISPIEAPVTIPRTYGADEARDVIRTSQKDYADYIVKAALVPKG